MLKALGFFSFFPLIRSPPFPFAHVTTTPYCFHVKLLYYYITIHFFEYTGIINTGSIILPVLHLRVPNPIYQLLHWHCTVPLPNIGMGKLPTLNKIYIL